MEGFEWHLCTCCLNESKVATLSKILVKDPIIDKEIKGCTWKARFEEWK